jgi:hypothetical protein
MKMGFTENEVGHMTYHKWKQLFQHFKAMHNFDMAQNFYDLEAEKKNEAENNIVYF